MKRTSAAAFLLFLACATTPESRIRSEIQAEYDKLGAASNRQDIDAVLSFRLPNFESFPPEGGRHDAAQMAEYTRNWLMVQNKPPIDVRFTVLSVEVRSNDEAAVKVLQRASRYQDHDGKRVHVEHEVVQRRQLTIRDPRGSDRCRCRAGFRRPTRPSLACCLLQGELPSPAAERVRGGAVLIVARFRAVHAEHTRAVEADIEEQPLPGMNDVPSSRCAVVFLGAHHH